MKQIVSFIAVLVLAAACSAATRPHDALVTGEIRAYMEDKEGMLEEVQTLPPDFLQRGIWLAGIDGDVRIMNDSSSVRAVLYMTDDVRRVRLLDTVLYATRYYTAQPMVFDDAQVVVLVPHRWNRPETRPMLTLRLAPTLP